MIKNLLRQALMKRHHSKCILSSDYARHYGHSWRCVYNETLLQKSAPQYFGSIDIDLTKKLDHAFPALGVLELEAPLVFRKSGWIFDKNRSFLPEFSWFGKHFDEIEHFPRFFPQGKRLPGTAVSFASDFAIGSYGHFVYDVISRLHLFQKSGFVLEEVDHIICPKPTKGNAELLFNQLGLPKNKMVWMDEEKSLRPDRLLAISFPGTRRNYPEWVSRFIQTSFIPAGNKPQTRRLYITRKGYRRNPSNLEEVEKLSCLADRI